MLNRIVVEVVFFEDGGRVGTERRLKVLFESVDSVFTWTFCICIPRSIFRFGTLRIKKANRGYPLYRFSILFILLLLLLVIYLLINYYLFIIFVIYYLPAIFYFLLLPVYYCLLFILLTYYYLFNFLILTLIGIY